MRTGLENAQPYAKFINEPSIVSSKLIPPAKKNGKGIATTISINDRLDNFGQNVGEWIAQTKEEREAKKERNFVGNGKVVYIDPNKTISVAPKSEKTPF